MFQHQTICVRLKNDYLSIILWLKIIYFTDVRSRFCFWYKLLSYCLWTVSNFFLKTVCFIEPSNSLSVTWTQVHFTKGWKIIKEIRSTSKVRFNYLPFQTFKQQFIYQCSNRLWKFVSFEWYPINCLRTFPF